MRRAWKEAALVFGLSRLIIVLLSMVSILVLPQILASYKAYLAQDAPYGLNLFYAWFRWDVVHYVKISFQAYKDSTEVVFFPLWPLLQHIVGLLLGGNFPDSYYLAGLFLSNLCFFFALVLLYRLVAEDFDTKTARLALFYLAFGPYALFFFAGYTESLFILLCVACFLLLRRGKLLDWWLAGLLGFLAVLTRSSGVLLAIPFLVVYVQRYWIAPEGAGSDSAFPTPSGRDKFGPYAWRQKLAPRVPARDTPAIRGLDWRQKLEILAPILLIPAGLLTYMLYLYYTKGNPLMFKTEEYAIWQRHFSLPWDTVGLVMRALVTSPSFYFLLGHLFALTMTLSFFVVAVSGWKLLPWHYYLFALATALFVVSFPVSTFEPLLSQPRYLTVIFPLSITLAIWSRNAGLKKVLMAISFSLFVLHTIYFTGNVLVA